MVSQNIRQLTDHIELTMWRTWLGASNEQYFATKTWNMLQRNQSRTDDSSVSPEPNIGPLDAVITPLLHAGLNI